MSWIRNMHSNTALRLSARARKGKYIGPPMATKKMSCKQLTDKLFPVLTRWPVTTAGLVALSEQRPRLIDDLRVQL